MNPGPVLHVEEKVPEGFGTTVMMQLAAQRVPQPSFWCHQSTSVRRLSVVRIPRRTVVLINRVYGDTLTAMAIAFFELALAIAPPHWIGTLLAILFCIAWVATWAVSPRRCVHSPPKYIIVLPDHRKSSCAVASD
jgi:hypothetical protein